ncbi:CHAP domain-containing protein [Weissella minor]|uniref:CHAP domain-containing protein n=1 Tax=Weissella minor TaxID=1620 RepID=UPI001BB05C1F|nr:CHAP domain-containing protein [Weissella minor]MBS0949063.1 CHAP domain-containing protein [Weissella minor]
MSEKKHLKLYKSGKLWVTALVGSVTLVGGGQQAHADKVDGSTNASDTTSTDVKTNQSVQTLPQSKPANTRVNTDSAQKAVAKPANQNKQATSTPKQQVNASQQKQATSTPKQQVNANQKKQATSTPKQQVNASQQKQATSTPKQQAPANQKKQATSAPNQKSRVTPVNKKAKPVVKNGWHGNQYYRNNQIVKGHVKINKNWYYFDKNGRAISGLFKNGQNLQHYEKNFVQTVNAYKTINQSTYYFGANGNAMRGVRSFKNGRGQKQIEVYNNNFKQVRNAYYSNNGGKTTYYLGNNGRAIQGIRKFKDNTGRLQIEAYHNSTFKQMRNAYYRIGKNSKVPSAYYLGKNGRAVKGLRKINAQKYEYYDTNFKQVRNKTVAINSKTTYRFENNGLAKRGKNGKPTNLRNVADAGKQGFYRGAHTYPARQCTAFVANILASQGVPTSKFHFLGNGAQWSSNARSRGVKVNRTPQVGAVVSFKNHGYSAAGHVAYITHVNPNGTFVIAEGNYNGRAYNQRTISMNAAVSGIIHF